ncbi:Predicted E3 ubiquitin ligase involved in peroxisome organization [Ceraceosorus bombacis]|uniref:Peroxisome assembly protein 12 n=1 Tax=Ceraceosorus bombacis TaxID=401625 RepID=A0A0P1BT89_9BASI|nr:Predicted E3 ubiquitin ligase involved in peroxisome organization [Ceraceosorus bombacis]
MDLLQSVDPTSGQQGDPFRPSFFELIAQDQLRDLLKPALRYVLAVLAQRNPRYLIRVANRFDEVYALAMFAVERHYLTTWGSSFAENFYGLRRRRRPGLSSSRSKAFSTGSTRTSLARYEKLRSREINLSLFLLVGAPWIKSKLHDYWESIGGGAPEGGLFDDEDEQGESGGAARRFAGLAQTSRTEQLRELFRKCFRSGYPYVGAGYQLWLLSYNVAYLFDRTPYWRPWLQAMRVDVRRVSAEDYPASPPLLPPDMPNPLRSPISFALALLRASPFIFFEALKYALPASIFFFKFLEWWYSADNPRCLYKRDPAFKQPLISTTRAAPTRKVDKDGRAVLKETKDVLLHNACPLCGSTPINNPCVLPTGYALCYTCAHGYVDEHSRCPVTLVEISGGTADLRRVLG